MRCVSAPGYMRLRTYIADGCRSHPLPVVATRTPTIEGGAMKFMMQIFQGEALDAWTRLSEEEQQGIQAGYAAVNDTPGVTPGEWLSPPTAATTVRLDEGAAVTTDGPFAETKEALGGYFMFEGESLEAAIAVAAKVPALRFGGAVEVRPIVEYTG